MDPTDRAIQGFYCTKLGAGFWSCLAPGDRLSLGIPRLLLCTIHYGWFTHAGRVVYFCSQINSRAPIPQFIEATSVTALQYFIILYHLDHVQSSNHILSFRNLNDMVVAWLSNLFGITHKLHRCGEKRLPVPLSGVATRNFSNQTKQWIVKKLPRLLFNVANVTQLIFSCHLSILFVSGGIDHTERFVQSDANLS